jgi:hypothetical protein
VRRFQENTFHREEVNAINRSAAFRTQVDHPGFLNKKCETPRQVSLVLPVVFVKCAIGTAAVVSCDFEEREQIWSYMLSTGTSQ